MINFLTNLLDYQVRAVTKLINIKIGALYMDPGTGKTRTALEFAQRRIAANKIDKVIWLCPTSETVKRNLIKEFIKHCTGWQSYITMCGIETLSTSARENKRLLQLASEKRCFLVIDESLLVKNPFALRSKHILKIAELCPYRMLLNGTPISKNLADLFSQWYILDWRILGYKSYWSFSANHLEYDDKFKNKIRRVLNQDYLTDKIAPYTFQVSKSDSLPPKKYETYYFKLTDKQADEYERVKEDFLSLDTLYSNPDSPIIYRLFNALQQITSGRTIDTPARRSTKHHAMFENPMGNPRIQALLEAISSIPSDEKVVIWCKFSHEILDVKNVLESMGNQVSLCYGAIAQKRRGQEMERFENSSRFLVANKGCAGYSLNLQYSHNAIFYNNDWDWATREQAEERQHRTGQLYPVKIIDICASCKIDERIISCLWYKEKLGDEFKKRINSKNLANWLDGEDDLKDDTDRIIRKTKAG